MIRSGVEVTLIHLERFQDVLIDINLVIVERQAFNYLPEKNYSQIRITETASRFEKNFRKRQHRFDLRVFLRLERLPVFPVFVRKSRITKTRAVIHQLANRDFAHFAVRIMHGFELGQIFCDRIVQFQ